MAIRTQQGGLFTAWALAELAGAVVWLVVVRAMWRSIQGSFAGTSPGTAVGLFFVPLFNLYWLLEVHLGFVRDYNRLASVLKERLGSAPARVQMWPFLLYTIAFLAWVITGYAVRGAAVVGAGELVVVALRALVLARVCDAVNALNHLRQTSDDIAFA